MKKIILLLFVVVNISTSNANEIMGKWVGTLYQEPKKEFYCEIIIDKKAEGIYTGTALYRTKVSEHSGQVLYKITMTPKRKRFEYKDIVVLNDKKYTEGFRWCMKQGLLKISKKRSGKYLTGKWHEEGSCSPGSFKLKKVETKLAKKEPVKSNFKLNNRLVNNKASIYVNSNKVIVSVWDDNIQDGDIISLHMNKNWILKDQMIVKKKKDLFIELSQLENTLTLHAENLGKYPPNTAKLAVDDGKTIQYIVLSSDKKKSESIKIIQR